MGKKKANKDFQKVKLKVGRTLKRSTTFTNTTFKAKKIKLSSSKVQDVLNTSKLYEGKSFKELLRIIDQPGHARLGAARQLGEMMAGDPGLAGPEAVEVILRLGMHGGPEEQRASLATLRKVAGLLGAAGKVLGAHLGAGLVHHRASIRRHSLALLQIMIEGQAELLRGAQPLTLISRILSHLEPAALRPLDGLLVLAGGLLPSDVHDFAPQANPVAPEQWEPLLDRLSESLMTCGLELVADNKLSPEKSQHLLNFLKCWSHLMGLAHHLGLFTKFQETYAATFEKFFLKDFAYISQLPVTGSPQSVDQDSNVILSNIRLICIYLHLHGKNLEHRSPLVDRMVHYMVEICDASYCDVDLAQQLLLVLKYLATTLTTPDGLFKHFMKLVLMLYKNAPMNHRIRHSIFIALNDIIVQHFLKLKNIHMVKMWVGAAPIKMARFHPDKVESCLDSLLWLLRLPHHHFPECQLAMQENLDRFLGLLSAVDGEKCEVGMVNLISLVPHLDRKTLSKLLALCCRLSPPAVNQLIYLLAKRMEASVQQAQLHNDIGYLQDSDISLPDFFSFLLALITGLSQESKESLPKLSDSPGDSFVMALSDVDMSRHLDFARTARNELMGLLPPDLIGPVVKLNVETILSWKVKIPVHCALSTLTLLPHFPEMWSPRLARLARDLLLHLVLEPLHQGYPLTLLLETIAAAGIVPQLLFQFHTILQSQEINLKMAKSIMLAVTQLAYCGLIRSLEAKKLLLQLLQVLKELAPPADQERDWWVDMESHLEMCCH